MQGKKMTGALIRDILSSGRRIMDVSSGSHLFLLDTDTVDKCFSPVRVPAYNPNEIDVEVEIGRVMLRTVDRPGDIPSKLCIGFLLEPSLHRIASALIVDVAEIWRSLLPKLDSPAPKYVQVILDSQTSVVEYFSLHESTPREYSQTKLLANWVDTFVDGKCPTDSRSRQSSRLT